MAFLMLLAFPDQPFATDTDLADRIEIVNDLEVASLADSLIPTNQNDMSIIKAAIEKINQDKLATRTTTLSKIDQDFLDATVDAAAEAEIEVPAAFKKRSTPKPTEVAEEEAAEDSAIEEIILPTKANKKAEIHAFMDEHSIAYETDNNIDTLLRLIDAWHTEKN